MNAGMNHLNEVPWQVTQYRVEEMKQMNKYEKKDYLPPIFSLSFPYYKM